MNMNMFQVQETVWVPRESFHPDFGQIQEVKPFRVKDDFTYRYRLFGDLWFFESELKPYKKARG